MWHNITVVNNDDYTWIQLVGLLEQNIHWQTKCILNEEYCLLEKNQDNIFTNVYNYFYGMHTYVIHKIWSLRMI